MADSLRIKRIRGLKNKKTGLNIEKCIIDRMADLGYDIMDGYHRRKRSKKLS